MKKSLLISSIAIATILLGGTTVSADVTAGTAQPGTGVVTPGTDTSTPTPGTDTSTPTLGTDTSTPTQCTDTNTPTPGIDSNTPNPGTTPGTSSNTPTSPIMTPTPEAPVDLGNNKVITGITNGVATLSDGSSKTLTELGAKENSDNTYTVKTKDNKLVTLPHTGDSKNTIFKILGLLSAFASMVLAFKSKKELK